VQEQVVAARDRFAARATDHPGAVCQAGADRHVAVAGQQWGQQRQQGVQVGGQIYVHVGVDVGVAGRPDRAQRAATPGPLQPDRMDQREFSCQREGLSPGAVGATVVRDRDAGGERKFLTQVGPQSADARCQVAVLVADRDDDLHQGTVRSARRLWRFRLGRAKQGVRQSHARHHWWSDCTPAGARLAAAYEWP
jgi:hypothetical protein